MGRFKACLLMYLNICCKVKNKLDLHQKSHLLDNLFAIRMIIFHQVSKMIFDSITSLEKKQDAKYI